jgi:protein-tyrosine kinase
MERLQAALSRARERRGEPSSGGPIRRRIAGEVLSGTPVNDTMRQLWDELPKLVPDPRHLHDARVVSYFGMQEATPFDMMRTKIVQLAKANNWKRIAITSPTTGCGKTMVAANLAFSLARQNDTRTVVIETDMRRPSLARVIGAQERHYFAKVLAGQEPPSQHMLCYAGNVAFATNDAPTTNPSELLQSQKTQEVLAGIEQTYQPDLVLFDTSPLLATDDTLGFLEHVDAALLVAAAEITTIDQIDLAEAEIANVTQVLGVVLNKCRYPGGDQYGYGYGYS